MATYAISFRIAHDADHSNRWSSTVDAIRNEALGGSYWEETTSFLVIRSHKTAQDLATAIYVCSSFNSTKDTMIVINCDNGAHCTYGEVMYPETLASLFRKDSVINTLAFKNHL